MSEYTQSPVAYKAQLDSQRQAEVYQTDVKKNAEIKEINDKYASSVRDYENKVNSIKVLESGDFNHFLSGHFDQLSSD